MVDLKTGIFRFMICIPIGGGGGRCSGGLVFCQATGQCTHEHFCKG